MRSYDAEKLLFVNIIQFRVLGKSMKTFYRSTFRFFSSKSMKQSALQSNILGSILEEPNNSQSVVKLDLERLIQFI